jgi:dTDP-4-dehydrorhamnose reductase
VKIIITGASGVLGTECCSVFKEASVDVVCLTRESAWKIAQGRTPVELKEDTVVVHAAANTDVEFCEMFPDSCYRDNFLLSQGIAQACHEYRSKIVYISSAGVYGEGKSVPYCEYDDAHPTTHHHRSKLLAEKCVLAASNRNLVLRTGWLYGGSVNNPRNFVSRMIKEFQKASAKGTVLYSNVEQKGSPTFGRDVAKRILDLINGDHQGVFNVVNEGTASRFEYVKAIGAAVNSNVVVEPASAIAFERVAKVSPNEMARNWRSQEIGLPCMPNWHKSLVDYIKTLHPT